MAERYVETFEECFVLFVFLPVLHWIDKSGAVVHESCRWRSGSVKRALNIERVLSPTVPTSGVEEFKKI